MSGFHARSLACGVLYVALSASHVAMAEVSFTEVRKVVAPDGAREDNFGFPIALDGGVGLVGAIYRNDSSGGVYVLTESGSGIEPVRLPDEVSAGRLGRAFAVDGSTALIAVSGDVLEYDVASDGTLTYRSTFPVPDGATTLGADGVALDGDRALVAVSGASGENLFTGKVYAFERDDGGNWSSSEVLEPPDVPGDYLYFGDKLALDGDSALIATGGSSNAAYGVVYAYGRDADGWRLEQALQPTDAEEPTFGSDVALDGGTALIGAFRAAAPDGGSSVGAAWIFEREPADGTWSEVRRLDPTNAVRRGSLFFGRSVALDGDVALVGAFGDATDGSETGAVYAYHRAADGIWGTATRILAADGSGGDAFGFPVALDGDTALVGATGDDTNGFDAGAVYVYRVSGRGPADADGDGVPDAADACASTELGVEPIRGTAVQRYYSDENGVFVDGRGDASGLTVTDTAGCSGQQILERLASGDERQYQGQRYYGLTVGSLRRWVRLF